MEEWKVQLMNSVKSIQDLEKYLNLSESEKVEITKVMAEFGFSITPYFAALMDSENEKCPIRMQAVPDIKELQNDFGEKDPLMEANCSPCPLIIHVYPDRVAFLVSNACAMYCRHCLRKYTTKMHSKSYSDDEIVNAIEYIRTTEQIRDVLLTGGDPLMLSDEKLEWIISELRAIPHVEVIRIGTRMICTLPQRITDKLCNILQKYHPIWINTQFNHPKELTPLVKVAVDRLLLAGIPIGNQTVLLQGINDSLNVMKQLVQKLVYFRIRPYYIYQAQTLYGTEHFITPIEKGIEIMRNLRGYTSGICIPQYVLDTPYGKVPISPNYVIGRDGNYFILTSYDGKVWREFNPIEVSFSLPEMADV